MSDNIAWERLFAAIWHQAVEDETKNAMKQTYVKAMVELNEIGIENYSIDSLVKITKDIYKRLNEQVKQYVYAESDNWPVNPDRPHTYDKYFNEIMSRIRTYKTGIAPQRRMLLWKRKIKGGHDNV